VETMDNNGRGYEILPPITTLTNIINYQTKISVFIDLQKDNLLIFDIYTEI